jgi:hypothetical protein
VCAQYDRPAGVVNSFHVCENSVDPTGASRCRNLLTKDDPRSALADELEPRRPKVARIGFAVTFPRSRERLTGTATRPDGSVVRPSGEPQRVRPSADPGEEMTLLEASQVGRSNIDD